MVRAVEIAADHPSFAGHFPRFPVLPGAVLLDTMLRIVERDRGIDPAFWRIASAKFFDMVRPGDALLVEHVADSAGSIRFMIHSGVRKVAGGTLIASTRSVA
jgi:3-hydroxymyristoyl/3-hydroxydecanoyl-(acyl carrier protein) dehydratase